MKYRNFSNIIFTCLLLALLFSCKPTSFVPAKLILHAPLYGTARADGTLYVFGDITNVGDLPAYNGWLFVIVNEGEAEHSSYLGDFNPGECKPFECDLEGYYNQDEARCTFRLTWNQERMLAYVCMDSARVSDGD